MKKKMRSSIKFEDPSWSYSEPYNPCGLGKHCSQACQRDFLKY